MIAVYINYPNKYCSIHQDSSVEEKQIVGKSGQRVLKINISNLSDYLQRFRDHHYKFQSSQEFNDLWLEINLRNLDFEIAVVRYILFLLGQYYKPFRETTPEIKT
jgi:hypothetical protein